MTAPADEALSQYRLLAVEKTVEVLRDQMIHREWLDERFSGLRQAIAAGAHSDETAIAAIRDDIGEMKARDKARRNAVYAAVVGSVVSLVVAMVTAGVLA